MADTTQSIRWELDQAIDAELFGGCAHDWQSIQDRRSRLPTQRCTRCRKRMNILKLTYGRDALRTPAYSTDIGAAWQIVEKMRSRGYRFTLEELDVEPPWTATFSMPDIDGMGDPVHWYESGDTAMTAICAAALSAVRAGESTEAP